MGERGGGKGEGGRQGKEQDIMINTLGLTIAVCWYCQMLCQQSFAMGCQRDG